MTMRPRLAYAGTLAFLVAVACALPAQATVIDRQHYAGSFTESAGICGIPVTHDVEFSGVYHLRVGTGDLDSLFFAVDNYDATDTLTNPANGKFVLIEHNGVLHDTKGTLVGGTIFKATTIEAGQPLTIRDMSGRVVSRDRGVIRSTYLWDTLGDDTPGGILVKDLGVIVAGPHPMFPFDDATFCAVVKPLIS
jgi:hypothetical protein